MDWKFYFGIIGSLRNTVYTYVLYSVHQNAFFWNGFRRFCQNLKGVLNGANARLDSQFYDEKVTQLRVTLQHF